MYDNQHILAAVAPPVVAVLPNTGGEAIIQVAAAVAIGMVVWGFVYAGGRSQTAAN